MLKKITPIILIVFMTVPLFGFIHGDINQGLFTDMRVYAEEEKSNEDKSDSNENLKLETKEEQEKREERERIKQEEEKRRMEKEREERAKKEKKKKKEKPRMKLNENGELVEETEEEKLQREQKEEEAEIKKEKKKKEKQFNTTNVEYTVEIQLDWTKDTHPKDYPDNGHITKFLGVTHTRKGGLWKVGGATSEGMLDIVKDGKLKEAQKEMKKQVEKERVNDIFEMDSMKSFPNSTGTKFKVSRDRPFVSFAAGIIPSPDWFVGVTNIKLLEKDLWVKEKEVLIYAYDAGTHEGTTYTADTKKAKTVSKIMRIEMEPFLVDRKVVPVGKAIFRLVEESVPSEQYNTSYDQNSTDITDK